jgi:hypothetical protein
MKVVLIGIMLILYRNGSAWNEVRMPIPQRYESHHHHRKGVDRKQIQDHRLRQRRVPGLGEMTF